MEWQHVLTWFAVALASAYVLRRGWHALRGTKGGCGGGCGCPKSNGETKTQPTLIAPEQLALRRRSGPADS
jgi:hypothetical protein